MCKCQVECQQTSNILSSPVRAERRHKLLRAHEPDEFGAVRIALGAHVLSKAELQEITAPQAVSNLGVIEVGNAPHLAATNVQQQGVCVFAADVMHVVWKSFG